MIDLDSAWPPSTAPEAVGRAVVAVGPLEVRLSGRPDGFDWSVGNAGDRPVRLRALAVVARVQGAVEPLRMFRHGYQSWSPSAWPCSASTTTPRGAPTSPSSRACTTPTADAGPDGELRRSGAPSLADADDAAPTGRSSSGSTAATATTAPSDCAAAARRGAELRIEAFLGGAELGPGQRRALHGVSWARGADGSGVRAARALGDAGRPGRRRPRRPRPSRWAGAAGTTTSTRSPRPTSARNLAAADVALRRLPARRRLPGGHRRLARHQREVPVPPRRRWRLDIAAQGRQPGLWLAPFLAAPDSELVPPAPRLARPLRRRNGDRRLRSWWNPPGAAARTASCTASTPPIPRCWTTSSRCPRRSSTPASSTSSWTSRSPPASTAGWPTRPDAGRAGARRLRRHPPRGRRRHLHPRVRRAAGQRGRGGRRQPHRSRRGAVVGARPGEPRSSGRLPERPAGHPLTPSPQHAGPQLHAPAAVAQRPRLPDAAHRPPPTSTRPRAAPGPRASPCRVAWPWCPTTWTFSAPRRGHAWTRWSPSAGAAMTRPARSPADLS